MEDFSFATQVIGAVSALAIPLVSIFGWSILRLVRAVEENTKETKEVARVTVEGNLKVAVYLDEIRLHLSKIHIIDEKANNMISRLRDMQTAEAQKSQK